MNPAPKSSTMLVRPPEPWSEFLLRLSLTEGRGPGEWFQENKLYKCVDQDIENRDRLLNFLHTHRVPYQFRDVYPEGFTNYVTYLSDLDQGKTSIYRKFEDAEGNEAFVGIGAPIDVVAWRHEPPHLTKEDRRIIHLASLLFD